MWCLLAVGLAACGGSSSNDSPRAPSITSQPASVTATAGATASFSVTATGGNPLAYQWQQNGAPISGATAASFTTPPLTSSDNGALFTVVVSNGGGTITSTAATLTVGAGIAPSLVTQPVAQSVVAPAAATFAVAATGSDPLAYQWTRNGVTIAGATAASYTTPATTIADDNGALFAVTISNAAGTATSDNAALTVTAGATQPLIVTQPASQTVNAGQTASFSVVVTGTAPLAYQWSKNGTAIAGATAASYTTPATADADTGSIFNVTITNAAGSVTSADATLTITPLGVAPSVTSQPASVSVNAGQAASFSVTAAGSATLTYQWKRDGIAINGATSAAYTLASATAADNGAQFTVTVANGVGTVTSNAATLTVVGSASVAPTISAQPANTTVTEPAAATFSVTATGTAPLAYQWRRNGVAVAGATAASYSTPPTTVAADNGATFSVIVSNGTTPNATSTSATLTVVAAAVAPSIATQPADAAVNAGDTATFSVVANGTAPLAYQWRKNGTNIVGATNASYTTPATAAGDNGARFSVVVSNGTAPNATSNDATLTVNATWTGIRQDGAPLPTPASQTANDAAKAVATDPQGNVIIGGYTTGNFAPPTNAAAKPFIAKYSAGGTLMWARWVLDSVNVFGVLESVNGVAADAAGNIYVTGQTLTTLAGEVAAGGTDVFVAKFDPSGNRLWAHQFGSSSTDTPTGIAVDTNGNAFVVGTSSGQLPLQPPPGGTTNYFIGKYDTNGNRLWLSEDIFNAAHGVPYNEAHGVAVDGGGNAYLVGFTSSQTGGSGAYVVKFNGAGARQWETKFGGAAPNDGLPVAPDGVAVSADGSAVFVAGRTYVDFDTAGNPPVASFCCLTGDAFVARFNSAGTLQWVHNLSSLTLNGSTHYDDEAFAIATNAAGSAVFITGYTAGVMPGEQSKGAEDVFVARYEADGTRTWVRQLGSSLPATTGGAQNERAFGIALDLHGDLFVAGVTHGTFGTPLKNTDRDDWFVFKMKPSDGSLY